MSERYARLFSLPEDLYSVGAPVVIAAGALLKDNQTGKVLAQLKIQNISGKAIKAATVSIAPLDTIGKPLGEAVSYQYLDLNAGRDAEFGQKTPIAFPDASTRAFNVSVSEVIFSDNTVWTASDMPWEPLSAPVPLEHAFDDRELVTQYRIKYGENCKCIFKQEKDLWRCACGALNHENERFCHKCRKEAAVLAAVDLDELKAGKDKRLEIAKQKAAEEKAAVEAKAKKVKKLAMIIAPFAVVVIVIGIFISGNIRTLESYNGAISALDAKDYETAVGVLEELGDYKDSQSLLKDARYHYAIELINSCNYSTAITELEALGDYENSVELRKKAEIGEDAYIEIDTVAIELAYWEEDLNTDGTFYNCGVLDVSGVFFLKENRVELFFLMDSESKEFANRNLKIILEDWKTEDLLYMLAEMGFDITLSVGEVYSSDEVSPDAFTQLVEDYASAGTGYFIGYYDYNDLLY